MQFDRAGIDSGPRPRRLAPPTDVIDSAANEPPCSPRTIETTSNPPVAPKAIRMAISLASDPVTAKFVILRSPGRVVAKSSANSTAQGLVYQDD